MDNIVMIGSGGHAKVVADIVEREGRYHICGFLDGTRAVGEITFGYQVLGQEQSLPALVVSHSLKGAIVAIGDNFVRSQVAARVGQLCPSLPFVTAVHPRAAVARGVSIGEGTVVVAGVAIGPCCAIGRFCILNTNSSLDHDSTMDDFSSLAPRAVTGGNCRIGACSAISIGAVLSHRIVIGDHCVIGAGAVVLHGVESFKVAYGAPARTVRERKCGDRYL